jgi:protein-disulfide isomerase
MRPDAKKKIAAAAPKKGPNPVVIGAVIAAVMIVGVVAAILIGNSSKSGSSTPASGSAVPVGVVGGTGGGILVNPTAKGNAPTVDVYADFQCPVCGNFEKTFGPTLTQMANAGEIKYIVHMMSFLDANLRNDSSARSSNAAACAADAGKFPEYHSGVFAIQPAKEGDGYTDAQLAEVAKTAGITGPALTTWQQCTSSGQHNQYVDDVATTSGKAGVNSTPTVKIDGKDITKTLTTADALVTQVKLATK